MSNIPSFSDVCGTVVESLAETIQNREKIIIQLREDNARLQRRIELLLQSRRSCRADFTTPPPSDSDPQTGVQYGDLT
jgi:hypothetical protein